MTAAQWDRSPKGGDKRSAGSVEDKSPVREANAPINPFAVFVLPILYPLILAQAITRGNLWIAGGCK